MVDANRRRLLATLGGALGATMIPAGSRSVVWAQENRITVTSLGGKWEQSIREHFIPLFKERTGAEVDVVLGGPSQWMAQITSQPGNPPLDAIDNSETLAYTLIDEGLAVQLTADTVPNLADTPDVFRKPWDDFGAMYMYAAAGFAYNKDRIKNPPKSWPEFFERAGAGEFGRAISMPDITYGWAPAFLWTYAEAFGGSVDKLDPAFEAVEKAKPYVAKFWANAGEFEQLMSTGEIDIGVFWDGRTYSMIDGGAAHLGFERPESGNLINGVTSQVVKGGNEKLALEYVNTLLDPVPQRQYFDLINYAVTNRKVEYPPEVRGRILAPDLGVIPPYRELAAVTPQIMEEWNSRIRF